MRTLAHIVNPVIVDEASDLFIAQPITFRTMEHAQEVAKERIDVTLYTAQYAEDRPLVPDSFTATPDLTRSVMDVRSFRHARKLPLLKDVLDRLYEASDAEYMAYTNVDIGLMPHFYTTVDTFIENGYDAFTINRRTISDRYSGIEEIPEMYKETMRGAPHPGYDCFVFRRDAYSKYDLGNICIGINWVGSALLANMAHYAKLYKKFKDKHLTFHIGDQRTWRSEMWSDYRDHNTLEMTRISMQLKKLSAQQMGRW